MDRTNEEQMWELTTNVSRSDRDRRHSSSASSSSQSTEDRQGSQVSSGRRTRPSVSSISSQLPTVREQKELRALSLASDETVISSKKVLTDFRKVASRDPEGEKRRREKSERFRAENQDQRDVYNRLKDWADSHVETPSGIIPRWLLSYVRKSPLPKTEELLSLARHYYPPRVSNCKLSAFRTLVNHYTPLGSITSARVKSVRDHKTASECRLLMILDWQVKPDWVDVRWMYAPLYNH